MEKIQVIFDVTENGWKREINYNDKKYFDCWEKTKMGAKQAINSNFDDDYNIPEDLRDILSENIGYNLMVSLLTPFQ